MQNIIIILQRYLPLGIGLCYLGKQDAAEATMAALEVIISLLTI